MAAMTEPRGLTSSQTVGPFFHLELPWSDGPDVVPAATSGSFWIRGAVLDSAGDPVPDALIETWQADVDGCFDHPDDPRPRSGRTQGFRGFGRCPTDDAGRWAIRTVKPGIVPAADGSPQAPHLTVSVFARGLLDRVVTRIYFGDESAANAADPLLGALPDDRARETLVAAPTDDGYHLDIHLQGEHETVFLVV
jgi:protocatechuate 3,4-dioxygenase, alpha subunit